MNLFTNKNKLCRTSFLGGSIEEVAENATRWLNSEKTIKIGKSGEEIIRKNSFYFSQLVQSYDGELGYQIDIYHAEIQ